MKRAQIPATNFMKMTNSLIIKTYGDDNAAITLLAINRREA
jgi:hypothetical protein